MRNQIGLLLITALIFSSCKQNKPSQNAPEAPPASRQGIDPAPEAQAAPGISTSFGKTGSVSGTTTTSTDAIHVVIKKAALSKEFLLLTNLIQLLPAPQFSSQDSLIVSFIKRDNKIFMLNVTRNQQVGQNRDDLPLAEFTIISENADQIEIDFNRGMNQLMTATKSADTEDIHITAGQRTTPIEVSYLEDVKFEDEAMFITQKAQLRDGDIVSPVEIRYVLKPYQPDPSYIPLLSNDQTKVGYFQNQVPVLLANGEEAFYVNRWNPSKKIRYAISANTPTEMRESIKNGLLYWNRVLGADRVEVTQLEDLSIRAPYPGLNIVQWVDWQSLGTAYANWSADPRTGEILTANIFIPSGKPPVQDSRVALFNIGLRGFSPSAGSKVTEVTDPNVTNFNQLTQAMAQRNLFVTVAHESGHNMGLRHNFAGSLAANFDYKDRKSILQNFVTSGTLPDGFIMSSSVMDYFSPEDKSLLSETIIKSQNALSYDAMAINHLYKGQALPASRPAFCTDNNIEEFADCRRFDSGRSVVSFASGSYVQQINQLALEIYRNYFPVNKTISDRESVREINVNTSAIATRISQPFDLMTNLLKAPQLIAIRNPFMPTIRTQSTEIYRAEQSFLASEINRLGGLSQALPVIPDNLNLSIENAFKALLDSPTVQTNSLSQADKNFVLDQVKIAARQIRNRLINLQLRILSGHSAIDPQSENSWVDGESLTPALASLLTERFNKYALSKLTETTSVELTLLDGTKKTVQLPQYSYADDPIRLSAGELFSGKPDTVSWAYAEKLRAIQSMETEIAILGDQTKIDMTKLPDAAANWLLVNRTILSKLKASLPLAPQPTN